VIDRDSFGLRGHALAGNSPEEYRAFQETEIACRRGMVQAAKIRAE